MEAAREIPPGRRRRRRRRQRQRQPHFFKVYFPTLSSQRLVIPRAFWKHIEYESSSCVCLKGPSGNVWTVDLISGISGMSFQNGWEEFVADHSLELGDFLVFRHEGNLRFTVMIFDATASEKEDSFLATPCLEVATFERGNDEWRRSTREGSTKALVVVAEPQTDGQLIIARSTGGGDNALVVREALSEDLINCTEERPRIHEGSSITDEADEGSQSSEQELYIPQTLEGEQSACVCANSKKASRVASRGKSGMCSSLAPFRASREKPLCSSKYSEIKLSPCLNPVAWIEVKKEELESEEDQTRLPSGALRLQRQGLTNTDPEGGYGPDNSHKCCRGNSSKKIEKHNRLAVKRSIHKKSISSIYKNGKKQSCKYCSVCLIREKAGPCCDSVKIRVRMGAAKSNRRPITEEEKKAALEAANSFQSEYPFSLSIMRDSYVYHGFYMSIPMTFTKHFPVNCMDMLLWDPSGKSWTVRYNQYKGRSGFSAGWGAFSRANNLERDDVCVFEHFKPNEVRVHIFRVVNEITPLIWSAAKGSR